MTFVRWQHACHIDPYDCDGLISGKCYIFPETDGGNRLVYIKKGRTRCATWNHSVDENIPACKHAISQKNIVDLLTYRSEIGLYGIYLGYQTA